MLYYSFTDIMMAYDISKEMLKLRCKNGKIKSQKLIMSRVNPNYFKVIIPETELPKIEHLKKPDAVLIARDESQPDFYIQLWAKLDAQEEEVRKKREEKSMEWTLLDERWKRERATALAIESHKAVDEQGNTYSYSEYIQSETWQKKRLQRIELDNFQCRMCGSAVNLQVHHISYEHLGHEPMDDLVTLCYCCHKTVHKWDLTLYKRNQEANWYDAIEDDSPYWRKVNN